MPKERNNHLSTTKKTAMIGLLTALSVVIGWICKTYLTFGPIRITFENIPIILSGIFYGPFVGAIVAVLSDIVSCITSPNPALNPIITLGAASIGIISGIVSRYVIKRQKLLKAIFSVFLSHIVGSMLIKSIGLYLFWRYDPSILLLRIPLYLAISVCESVIIYFIIKSKYISSMFKKQIKK